MNNNEQKTLGLMADEYAVESEVARIERPTLHNVVVSRLRDMIIEKIQSETASDQPSAQ